MQIVVDHRELKSGVAAYLQDNTDATIHFAQLPLGDYCIDDLFLFERKTLPDLLASIKDGRIFRQVCRLASSPYRSVIILEGSSSDILQSQMSREAIQGVLIQISIFLRIPVLRAKDAEETAKLILFTRNQSQKLSGEVNGTRHFPHKRPQAKHKTQLYILQGIPGIGPKRAQVLLDHFASVEAVFSASEEELLHVGGINRKTARTICWAVKEQLVDYKKDSPASIIDDLPLF